MHLLRRVFNRLNDGPDLPTAERAIVSERFFATAYVGPIANTTAAIVWVGALWPHASHHERMVVWLAVMVLASVFLTLAVAVPTFRDQADRTGVPRLAVWSLRLMGAIWGSVLWLNIDALDDDTFRFGSLVVLFAVTAGSMGPPSGSLRLTSSILIPLWLGVTGALLVHGEWIEVIGVGAFVATVAIGQQSAAEAVRELITLRAAAEHRSDHDALTGLLNRPGAEARLADMPSPVSALFIDLDRFKPVNDDLGHATGDRLLAAVGGRLQRCIRTTDFAARVGGDEFFVAVASEARPERVLELAQRIVRSIAQPFHIDGHDVRISCSVGVAPARPGLAPQDLFEESDQAMLIAKRLGRGRAVVLPIELRRRCDVAADRCDVASLEPPTIAMARPQVGRSSLSVWSPE